MKIQLTPIAYVKNDRTEISDDFWGAVESSIILDDHLSPETLDGLDQFSHVEILFYFHRADPDKIIEDARHPRDNKNWPKVGIFARRGKNRPNHLGATIVQLLGIDGHTLRVRGLDAIDGTPVVDIKPVLRGFLPREEIRHPDWADEIMEKYWLS